MASSGVNDTEKQESKSFDDEVSPALFRYNILQSIEGNSTANRGFWIMILCRLFSIFMVSKNVFPVPCLFAPKAQKGIDKGKKKSTRF